MEEDANYKERKGNHRIEQENRIKIEARKNGGKKMEKGKMFLASTEKARNKVKGKRGGRGCDDNDG